MELGLFSFVEIPPDVSSRSVSPQQRVADLLKEIVLADQVGLDVYGVGEHHRPDYVASAPEVLLAAAAAQTERIRLTSAVTVLSSDDPVRVFQRFSTLDLVSGGRAEIIAGRGSFTESFPLFGQQLDDYHELFDDKLELLLRLRESERVTWEGTRHRAAIADRGVYPRPVQSKIPIWRAVGGTPRSVVQAAHLGLPLALAIIGGNPARFKPFVDLYRQAWEEMGHDPAGAKVSINTHGFIADTFEQAVQVASGPFMQTMTRIGSERGWPAPSAGHFAQEAGPTGALVLGDPQRVINKLLWEHEVFGHDRTLLQLTVGPIEHRDVLRAIELYGTVVAPAVRKAVGEPTLA